MVILSKPLSSFFFSFSSDFSDHNNTMSFGVNYESLKNIDEVGTIEGITTNTNDG
jgi:hypothetical protein